MRLNRDYENCPRFALRGVLPLPQSCWDQIFSVTGQSGLTSLLMVQCPFVFVQS